MLTIEFYESKRRFRKNEWRWRAIAANGLIIATGAEGYSEERWARNGFNVLKNGIMAEGGYKTRTVLADGSIV